MAVNCWRIENLTALAQGAAMHRTILATIGFFALASTALLAGDLPSRYAPPPPVGGGPGTKVGVLNCNIAPSVGLIIVSFQRMDCRFTWEGGGPPEFYSGTMSTLGVDLGFTAGGALTW